MRHCKKLFDDGEMWKTFQKEWADLMYSHTEASYLSAWESMVAKYTYTHRKVLRYLSRTWIPYAKQIISCYTNEFFHLGSTVTSRIEGAHRTIKAFMKNSRGDLQTAVTRIACALEHQLTLVHAALSRDTQLRLPNFNTEFFSSVGGGVAFFALQKVSISLNIISLFSTLV